MIEKNELLALLDETLKRSHADETELVLYDYSESLTRFANSAIHQNVREDNHLVVARVAVGKRIGVTETNRLDRDSLAGSVARAVAIAKESPQQPDFPGFPKACPAAEVPAFSEKTAAYTPDDRANAVAAIVGVGKPHGITMSGAYRTGTISMAVVNTSGTRQHYVATDAYLSVFAIAKDGVSGSAAAHAASTDSINVERVAEIAAKKCKAAASPIAIDAGPYDVILEPRATSEIMDWLSFTAFGAKQVQEGQSFMAGRIGEKMMGENVTIYDDGFDPAGIPVPFDFEGVPKKKVTIIENGIARGPVYDSLTAAKDGVASTGHAGIATFRGGPGPSNLFIASGKDSLDDLMARVKKGLLVTRFHYINGLLDTKRALFTGMTRDGTYLIENGKISKAVRNLRFTDSMLRAYSNVDGITRDREISGGNWGGIGSVTAPAMLLRGFVFTGTTSF